MLPFIVLPLFGLFQLVFHSLKTLVDVVEPFVGVWVELPVLDVYQRWNRHTTVEENDRDEN